MADSTTAQATPGLLTFLVMIIYSIFIWILLGFCVGIGVWLAGEVTGNKSLKKIGKWATKLSFKKKNKESKEVE